MTWRNGLGVGPFVWQTMPWVIVFAAVAGWPESFFATASNAGSLPAAPWQAGQPWTAGAARDGPVVHPTRPIIPTSTTKLTHTALMSRVLLGSRCGSAGISATAGL